MMLDSNEVMFTAPRRENQQSRGFALIELLVVLSVLSVITVIAAPTFLKAQDNARHSALEATASSAVGSVQEKILNDETSVSENTLNRLSDDENIEVTVYNESMIAGDPDSVCVQASWVGRSLAVKAGPGCTLPDAEEDESAHQPEPSETPSEPSAPEPTEAPEPETSPSPSPTPEPSPPPGEDDEWAEIPVGNGDWSSITYGNVDGEDVYIAVASEGDTRLMISNDGVNWQGQSDPSVNNISWGNINYGIDENGQDVLVATPTQSSNRYMTSNDGKNWQLHSRGNGHLRFADLVYGDFHFVGISENTPLSFSPDGKNWETFSTTRYDPNAITVGEADDGQMKVLLIGNLKSSDGFSATVPLDSMIEGQNWNKSSTVSDFNATSHPELQQAAYGDDRFVVVSYEGLMTSTDGYQWEQLDAPFSGATALTYGDDNGFLVANGDRVWHSSDLGSWEEVVHQPGANFVDATFGDDCFVVVSDAGSDRVVTNCS